MTNAQKDARIAELERQVDSLQESLGASKGAYYQIHEQLEREREEWAGIIREQEARIREMEREQFTSRHPLIEFPTDVYRDFQPPQRTRMTSTHFYIDTDMRKDVLRDMTPGEFVQWRMKDMVFKVGLHFLGSGAARVVPIARTDHQRHKVKYGLMFSLHAVSGHDEEIRVVDEEESYEKAQQVLRESLGELWKER